MSKFIDTAFSLSWDFPKKTHLHVVLHLPIRLVENSEYNGLIKKEV
jgi:hypothetical protein